MNNVERAVSYFKNGLNCSQALLSTYGPQLGLPEDTARKISAPFGGGIAGMAKTCGMVTGALMIIGLKAGNTEASDRKSKRETNRLAREFIELFQARNNSVICRELLGCDISTPEGAKAAKDGKLFTTLCPEFARDAAEIVEEVLDMD